MKQPNCLPCQGIQVLTPRTRHNRAGLENLKYRVGTHAAFLETMLANLAAQQINVSLDPEKPLPITPLNNRLTARTADDPSIAMLDAWALIADILAFYQERNANEGYLRTATQYRSVHELSRLVGYTPRPGLASSVYLAFEVEAAPPNPGALISLPVLGASPPAAQGDTVVLIPKGTPAKSTPVPGTESQPQHFETSTDLTARPEWNVIRPRQTRPIDITNGELLHLEELYFNGIGLRLEPNDLLAIVIGDDDDILPSKIAKILAVEESPKDQRTRVFLQPDSLSVPQLCRVVETELNAFQAKLSAVSLEAEVISNVIQEIQEFEKQLPAHRKRSLPDADSIIHDLAATTFLGAPSKKSGTRLSEVGKASALANQLVSKIKVHSDTKTIRDAYILAHAQLTAAIQDLVAESDTLALSGGFSSVGDDDLPRFSLELQNAIWKLIRSQGDVPNGLSFFLGRPSLVAFDESAPTPLKDVVASSTTGSIAGFKYVVEIIAGSRTGDVKTDAASLPDVTLAASEEGIRFLEIRITPSDNSQLVGFAIQAVNVKNAEATYPRLRLEHSICHLRESGRFWYAIDNHFFSGPNASPSPHLVFTSLDNADLTGRMSFEDAGSLSPATEFPLNLAAGKRFVLKVVDGGKAVVLSAPPGGTAQELREAVRALRYRPAGDGYVGLRILLFEKSPPVDSSSWPSSATAAAIRHLVFVIPKLAAPENTALQSTFAARLAIATYLGGQVQGSATRLISDTTVSDLRTLITSYFNSVRKAAIDILIGMAAKVADTALDVAATTSLAQRALVMTAPTFKSEIDLYLAELERAERAVRVELEKHREGIAQIVSEVARSDRERIGAVRAAAARTIEELDTKAQKKLPALTETNLPAIVTQFNQVGQLVLDVSVQIAEMAPISDLATQTGAAIARALVDRRKDVVGQLTTLTATVAATLFSKTGENDPVPALATEVVKDRILNQVRNSVAAVEGELNAFFAPGGNVDWQHPNTIDEKHKLKVILEYIPQVIVDDHPERLSESKRVINEKLKELRTAADKHSRTGVVERLVSTWKNLIGQMTFRKQPQNNPQDFTTEDSVDIGAVLKKLDSIGVNRSSGQSTVRIEDLAEILGNNAHILTQVAGVLDSSQRQLLYSSLRQAKSARKGTRPRVYVFRATANLFGWNSPLLKSTNQEGLQEVFNLYNALDSNKPDQASQKAKIKAFFDHLGIGASAKDVNVPVGGPLQTTDEVETESSRRLFLDGTFKKTVPGSIVAVQLSSDLPVLPNRVKSCRFRPRDAYRVSSNCTQLELLQDCWHPTNDPPDVNEQKYEKDRMGTLARARVWCDSEELVLAEAPIPDNVALPEIELDGVYFELSLGKKIIIRGRPESLKGIQEDLKAEVLEIIDIEHLKEGELFGDRFVTRIRVNGAGTQSLRRDSVQFLANIVEATHGETVQEVLGSGDSSREYQAFMLRRSPVTRLPAAKPGGQELTLAIRVNDIEWSRVSESGGGAEKAHSYSSRTGPDGQLVVAFGKDESRLPTGAENVRTTYRVGMGRAGNVDRGRIDQLPSPPRGLKGVQNPVRATGGANPDSIADAKKRVPLTTLAPTRLVSVRDFEVFAELFAGIGQATADLINGVVYVTIAAQDPAPIVTDSQMYRNLVDSLRRMGDPLQQFEVVNSEPSLLFVAASVRINANYQWPLVSAHIRFALLERFGFAAARFGKDITLSTAIATIQAVDGVEFVDVNKFDAITEQDREDLARRLTKDRLNRLRRIESKLARPNSSLPNVPSDNLNTDPGVSRAATQKPILPAQLCYLPADVPDMLILEQM